ncbi:MAG: hypothetical protein U5R46_05555 [Gammaproteobacteria bacterium]|nr:hypothetical protein [Gammaproteobacteria bacterium]
MIKKLLLILLSATVLTGPATADSQTRHLMQNVADSLEVLLPLSLDSDAFLDPANRSTVMDNLSRLEESADGLADHGEPQSLDFQLRAAAFERAAHRIRTNFEYLHPEEARYFLMDLTQHCVACHSGNAAGEDFPLSSSLNKYLAEQPLTERERARLQVALRQFDGAMDTWESTLSDPAVSPVDMSLDGNFVEYLTVAVRVRGAFERAARQLQSVANREDTPFYLRRRLATWVDDLEAAEQNQGQALTMERARQRFRRPDTSPGLLWNDAQLVSDLVLSAGLGNLSDSEATDMSPAELAEVYYMLGVLEARTIGLYTALPVMERFWEAAIRTAPQSRHAVEAYALLEESAATTFSGELPFEQTDETFSRLAELRELVGLD